MCYFTVVLMIKREREILREEKERGGGYPIIASS